MSVWSLQPETNEHTGALHEQQLELETLIYKSPRRMPHRREHAALIGEAPLTRVRNPNTAAVSEVSQMVALKVAVCEVRVEYFT